MNLRKWQQETEGLISWWCSINVLPEKYCKILLKRLAALSAMHGHTPLEGGATAAPADDTTPPPQPKSEKSVPDVPKKYRREDIGILTKIHSTNSYEIYSKDEELICEFTEGWVLRETDLTIPESICTPVWKNWAVEVLRVKGLLEEDSGLHPDDEKRMDAIINKNIFDETPKEAEAEIRARFGPNVHIEPGQDEDGRINGRWL